MKQPKAERLHIVEGVDWLTSIIALLEPRSSYRPWRWGFGEVQQGDPVAVVLGTEPRTVLTVIGRIGADRGFDRAVVDWTFPAPGLVDLDALEMLLGCGPRNTWQLHGKTARRLEKALGRAGTRHDWRMRFGHSSVAAARILLRSGGRCDGCDESIDLTGPDATEAIRIWTVDGLERDAPKVLVKHQRLGSSYEEQAKLLKARRRPLLMDWPGVLCSLCSARMEAHGYARLADFRFSQHPTCPRCGVQRARARVAGMPIGPEVHQDTPPWIDWRGCCDDGRRWTCDSCEHEW